MSRHSICIYGAGAIGLDLAKNLIMSGNDVTIIARGETLDALRSRGIVHHSSAPSLIRPCDFRAVSSAPEAGVHSFIFLTTRVDDLLEITSDISALLGSHSCVISATNGIPPWFSFSQESTIGRFTFSLEPRERFLSAVPAKHLLGCIVERRVELAEPGALKVCAGKGFTIGELDHTRSLRAEDVAAMLKAAGFGVTVSEDVHRDIWLKLAGNIAVNPLSVLSGDTIGEMLANPTLRARIQMLLKESIQVGVRLGVIQHRDFDEAAFFNFMSEQLGSHRPSMFYHFQRGKPLELHRILEVVEMLAVAPGPLPAADVTSIAELRKELALKVRQRGAAAQIA